MIEKNICFIYMDSAEKSFMDLLAVEAEKRGYRTLVTDNPFQKCDIGVYCQHINFPQYSKFSVIMLHDIIQQYGNWPDLWYREPWNKYDVGILPSVQWVNNWNKCSQWYYARPKKGMFRVGWPKADVISGVDLVQYRKEFNEMHDLDSTKKTILYAPAWENDNKQDDFVKAMLGLDVNIIIKQWDADPKKFPEVVENIKRMYELHKNIERVKILPPSMNIFKAIMASDILVSEESSTMSEAALVGVPAVSVSDWLIPDVKPSRYPDCHYDFVTLTKKAELRNCIAEMVSNYDKYKTEVEQYRNLNFSNIGSSCSMIMDIIDDCLNGKNVRYEMLKPKKNERVPLKKDIKRLYGQLYREMYANWKVNNVLFGALWKFLKMIKDMLLKKGRKDYGIN